MSERDAELFVYEFHGNNDRSGDAPTLTHTLNQILQDDLDRLWKKALASERATLLKPVDIEQSDDLRRRFAPIIKARSLAVQQSADPNRQRFFPDNIEFNCPRPTLAVSYQKQKKGETENDHDRRKAPMLYCPP